jgi:hypothetical protein
MGYRVVVVGATGNVGREMLNILAEREFPVDEIAAVASPRSTGNIIDFGDSGKELKVQYRHFDFADWDFALFAAGSRRRKFMRPGPPPPLHGDRQQLAVPDGSRRAADRAEVNPASTSIAARTSSPTQLDRPGWWLRKPLHDAAAVSASSSRPTSRSPGKAGMDSCSSRPQHLRRRANS